jgi:hypothetical protein
MVVILFVSMVVFFIYYFLWVQVLVTGMWFMRYAILGFLCLLFPLSCWVSRSSQRWRLGVFILVLVLIIFLGGSPLFFSPNDRFFIFQSVSGVWKCRSICIVESIHPVDDFLMLA